MLRYIKLILTIMSTAKQELSAILIDYADKIPDQVYIDILNRVAEIPDHIDPRQAGEIQQELDDTNVELRVQTERNDILVDEIYRVEAQRIKLNDMYKSQKKLIEKLKLEKRYLANETWTLDKLYDRIKPNNKEILLEEKDYNYFNILSSGETSIDTIEEEESLEDIYNLFSGEKSSEFDFGIYDLFQSLPDTTKYGYYKYVSRYPWPTVGHELTTYLLSGLNDLYKLRLEELQDDRTRINYLTTWKLLISIINNKIFFYDFLHAKLIPLQKDPDLFLKYVHYKNFYQEDKSVIPHYSTPLQLTKFYHKYLLD